MEQSVELEIVYARVHLLNEGSLYKMDQKIKKCINELQFYYITLGVCDIEKKVYLDIFVDFFDNDN